MNLCTAEAILHDFAEARKRHGDALCVSERALPHRRAMIVEALRIVYPTVADVPALRGFYEGLYADLSRYVPAGRARQAERLLKAGGSVSAQAVVAFSPAQRRRALENLQRLDALERERQAERERLEADLDDLRRGGGPR